MNKPLSIAHSTVFINPYMPCSAAIKFHVIPKLQHTTQTQHCSCTPQFLHTDKMDHICHAQYHNYIAATHNITLSMHMKVYYTPNTTHPLPSTTLLCTQLTQSIFVQVHGGKMAQNVGMEVLWCHSHWVLRVPSLHVLVFIQKTFGDLFTM